VPHTVSNRSKSAMMLVGLVLMTVSSSSYAARFEVFDDELEVSINSKAQVTGSWRTQDRSNSIIGKRNIPGQGGGGPGNLCDDDLTSGSADPLDALGGCVLDAEEHQRFVDAPGYFSQNNDDGNIAFDKGDLVASTLRLTTDISAVYGEYGFSGRLIGFYDPALDGELRRNSDFGLAREQQQEFQLASRGQDEGMVFATAFEQAFVYGSFALGDRTLSLTFGRQPISWGETTTFPLRSVNSINPPSVIRLNAAGGDSKEVFSPTEAIHMGIDLTDNLSMEAWYQFKFRSILDQLSANGSFFSTTDLGGPGATYAMLSFGKEPQDPSNLQDGDGINGDVGGARGCINPNVFEADGVTLSDAYSNGDAAEDQRTLARVEEFGAYRAHRGDDTAGRTVCAISKEARDDGQYGIQLKAYSERLNYTEFGFYFHNTHSRLPYAGAISTEQAADSKNGITFDQLRAVVSFDPEDLANLTTNTAAVVTLATNLVNDLTRAFDVVDTAALVLSFPEDIKTYGASFTTTFGDISVAGEFAYRQDDPVQVTGADLTLYALGPAFNSLRGVAGPSFLEQYRGDANCAANGEDYATAVAASGTPYPACSRIDSSTFIPGWELLDVGHASMTILAAYSDNPFSASQWLVIGDISATKIYGMPDKSVLQFAANGGDDLHASPGREQFEQNPIVGPAGIPLPLGILGAVIQNPSQEPLDTFADSFSWGFRVVNILKYPNAIFRANLDLSLAMFLDINGNSPAPAGDFLEGRKKLYVDFNFRKSSWNLQMRHTWFTGAGDSNLERDRDHAFVALGYEF
jgi:hypothetical protein